MTSEIPTVMIITRGNSGSVTQYRRLKNKKHIFHPFQFKIFPTFYIGSSESYYKKRNLIKYPTQNTSMKTSRVNASEISL